MILKHKETLIYYDGDLFFIAQDGVCCNYICVQVEQCDDYDVYFCIAISERRLRSFLDGGVDMRTVYQEPEDGRFYYARIGDFTADIEIHRIGRDDIPQDWFVDEGVYMGLEEVRDGS